MKRNVYERLVKPSRHRQAKANRRHRLLTAGVEFLENRQLLAGDLDPMALIVTGESEPNDGIQVADAVPLGFDANEDPEVDFNGILQSAADVDVIELQLNGGDVLAVNLFGAALGVSLLDTAGNELITSDVDANSVVFTVDTGEVLLPGGGNASFGRVISTTGRYFLQISTLDITATGGTYTAQLRVQRPVLENSPIGTHQILFVDFNGAVIDNAIFNQPGQAAIVSLSPLSSFLQSWGFSTVDENALIDSILANLEDNLSAEIRANGENGDFLATRNPGEFDIEILNSRDHADPFGQPNVSRLIIGGTQGQLGVQTIGIAQSIDVGNLDTTESAVVLLDVLSGQVNPASTFNLNNIPLSANASKIELVGRGIGGAGSHEAGHFFGLFHTDNVNAVPNLIDAGGLGIGGYVGVGPDGIFGSPDDFNPGFLTPDAYLPNELFIGGTEDTLNTLSWGLATGKLSSAITGVKFNDLDSDGLRDAGEPGLSGWTIFADLNGNGLQDMREPFAVTGQNGAYRLLVPAGDFVLKEVLQPGWTPTFPAAGFHTIRVDALNLTIPNINFGNHSDFGGISGTKFNDLDADGAFDQGEPAVPGVFIYLDLDGDNRPDLGEPMAETDRNGNYSIQVANSGVYTVREAIMPGWEITFPRNTEHEHTLTVAAGASVPGINFGNHASNDYGDAPDPYPTLAADNGPVHKVLTGFFLGAGVDGETDGVPSTNATGDDINTTINDEDGVNFTTSVFPGSNSSLEVTINNGGFSPGRLNAWADWNLDGDWDDAGEHFITDTRYATGTHTVNFTVPTTAKSGETYFRFRFGYGRNVTPTGPDMAGEVEDYRVRVLSERPVAVDDSFTVNQGDIAVTLDVLANDIPSLAPPLTIVAVSSPVSGGTVVIAPNGLSLRYTPPIGFFGNDRFSYTVRDGAGNTDSADVNITIQVPQTIPFAVDDSFTVNAGSTNNALPVLANDLRGPNPPIGIVNIEAPAGGTATLDTRGTPDPTDDVIRYTPAPGFTGTDQFAYTIEDANDVQSTARVTVHVDDADDDIVRLILKVTDANGEPIQAIGVGETFNLQLFTADDLRTDDGDNDPNVNRFGVAAAYLDILYDFARVAINGAVDFGDDYSNATSFNNATPGLFDEAGAFQTSQVPLGRAERLVLTVPMRATAEGVARFVGDPADRRTGGPLTPPDHDVLLFSPPTVVTLEGIRYENTTLTIVGSGGLPQAVDNTFHVAANSTNNILNVLANDVEVSNPPLRITGIGPAGSQPLRGSVSISADGSTLQYTPRAGFVGTEQFTYTATNAVQLSATATVTVQVGNQPNDVNIRLQTTNAAGTPISSITAGGEFQVRGFVQDIRTSPPDATRMGAFAIYFDLLYNSGLVSTVTDPSNRFNFDIEFAAPYSTNGLSANNSFANVIDEVGAFQEGDSAVGPSEFLVFTITFRANVPGVANFFADPADESPFHDILLFEPPAVVPVSRTNFGVASINIIGAAAEGEFPFTNTVNRTDVNGDGLTSPIDALLIFNDLNTNGSRNLLASSKSAAGEGESVSTPRYIDVSKDGFVSPVDALLVNNLLITAAAHGEGASAYESSLTDAASGASSLADLNLNSQSAWGQPLQVGPPQSGSAAKDSAVIVKLIEQPVTTVNSPVVSAPAAASTADELDEVLSDDLLEDIAQAWSEPRDL